MKVVLILRHAKSSWKEAGRDDHDRPLNKRGLRDAPRMGQLLDARGLVPDCVLSSTARRARQTAEMVTAACGFNGSLELVEDFYLAPPDVYVDRLAQLPDEVDRAMVIGHNPGLELLLVELTGQSRTLPTAALVRIDLPIDQWDEISDTRGELAGIWLPRELDPDES